MAGVTSILPIIEAKTSPIIILPTMDLKFHVLDVFIKSLHFRIDSDRLSASIFSKLEIIFCFFLSLKGGTEKSGR